MIINILFRHTFEGWQFNWRVVTEWVAQAHLPQHPVLRVYLRSVISCRSIVASKLFENCIPESTQLKLSLKWKNFTFLLNSNQIIHLGILRKSFEKTILTILTSSILEKLLTKTLTYTREGPSKNTHDIFRLFCESVDFTSRIEPRRPDSGIVDLGAEDVVQDLLFNLSIIRLLGHFVAPRENISFRPGMAIWIILVDDSGIIIHLWGGIIRVSKENSDWET